MASSAQTQGNKPRGRPRSGSTTPHSTIPNLGLPHSAASHLAAPHSRTPHSATPDSRTPHSATPHSRTPHSATPHSRTPHSATPHSATPHSRTPHSATPHSRAPTHLATPHLSTPYSGMPHSTSVSNSPPMQPTRDSDRGRRGRRGRGRQGSQSTTTADSSITVTSSSTGDSLTQRRSQSNVVDPTKKNDLEKNLKKRLDDLQLGKNRTIRNASAVNRIQEIILQHLMNDDRSLKWTVCPSGSYYERTKIRKPDEYDCMMVCKMRCKPDYSQSDDATFCAFRSLAINASGAPSYPASNPHLFTSPRTDGGVYICPKAFKRHFREKIFDAIKRESSGQLKDLEIDEELHEPECPAVTLTVRGQRGSGVQRLSMDIVSAIQLLEWPKPAETWRFRRDKDVENRIKHPIDSGIYPCAVAKIHHTEKSRLDNECILWRISFSAAEKQLTLHADQSHSNGSASNGQTCRKSILRLLKQDLFEFKANNEHSDALCSFHIKTTFLHLMDEVPDASHWTKDHLLDRYNDGLRLLVKSLQKGEIRHYFIRSANLLDEQSDKRQLRAVEHYFTCRLKQYTI